MKIKTSTEIRPLKNPEETATWLPSRVRWICYDHPVNRRQGLAIEANTGQTKAPFNSSSNGGSIESHCDAAHQAKEAKSQEGPRRGSKASKEAEEAEREKCPCRISGKSTCLAILKRKNHHEGTKTRRRTPKRVGRLAITFGSAAVVLAILVSNGMVFFVPSCLRGEIGIFKLLFSQRRVPGGKSRVIQLGR